MLEAFEADRARQEGALRDIMAKHAALKRKYDDRESRPEDLERIAEMEISLRDKTQDIAKMKQEMAYFKNELLNREENFNKKFGAAPNVGVMNVLQKPKKKKSNARPFG